MTFKEPFQCLFEKFNRIEVNFNMKQTVIPSGYAPKLNLIDTQIAIKKIKGFFSA